MAETSGARGATLFSRAVLLKPEPVRTGVDADPMAPLFMIEVPAGAREIPLTDRFAPGAKTVPTQPPTPARPSVYNRQSEFLIAGRCRKVLTYTWLYKAGPSVEGMRPVEIGGIRLVLDEHGFPMMCELASPGVSSDGTPRPRVVYVSKSLEDEAATAFGGPLPGRRFSIERAAGDAPGVVVADVFEDGPVPLGPYVYISAGKHEVKAVICRCSPARFEESAGTEYYELVPDPRGPVATPPEGAADTCPDDPGLRSVIESLRWPAAP